MAKSKYNNKIVQKIVDLIETDSYKVLEICKIVGINKDTYFHWKNTIPEFSDRLQAARQVFDDNCVIEAKKSLMKKVTGYTVDEVSTTYVDVKNDAGQSVPKIKEKKITKKHYQPDTTSIIFVLTNKASEEFKNKQSTESQVQAKISVDITEDDIKKFQENFNKDFLSTT